MESGGNENRIQALFSDLSLADQMSVPQFGRLWSRAQVMTERELRSFSKLVAVWISVMVTAAACSFAVWTWYRVTAPAIVNRLPQESLVSTPVEVVPIPQLEKIQPRRQKHFARRSQADRALATEAALLSKWQSPTQRFMESPTDLVPNSLPQLNQSVKDLESFLPKNNELMKESNR